MDLMWYDLHSAGVEGKGWSDTERPYDRFPLKARSMVPEIVWELSRHSTGMCAQFTTNATTISARWTVVSSELSMPHMPASSVSGLDLYGEDTTRRWRWAGIGVPETERTIETPLVVDLDGQVRTYRLYLPLFNELESLDIGVPTGATFIPVAPRTRPPIVFYGTSIVHGACASRSGMCHTAIIGRRLDVPVINLGFSGSAKMELPIAELLSEIDAAVYVIDCLPNMDAALVTERTDAFIRTLRAARPETPIVLVEDRTFTNAWIIPAKAARHRASRAAFRAIYDRLLSEGITGLTYVLGEQLLGDDDEATVDSSHPTDLGFVRQADVLTPVIAPLLEGSRR